MASSLRSLPLSILCYLAVASRVAAGDPAPLVVGWSDLSFGPDGPWPAIEVTLGSDQTISLYPGHEFQSFILTSDYCAHNTTCTAAKARLYNKERSQVDNTGSNAEIAYAPGPGFMSGLAMGGDTATSWVDNMELGGMTVPNVSLALLSDSYAVYPDQWYPLSVGCLGLGAPITVNQSFTTNGGPSINASLVPGYLNAHSQIPSNSFAMHIGSVNPPMPGSLLFGGYDQNRIIGDILSETDDYTKAISLKDISIRVVDGSSPWTFQSKPGLLAANNASISSGGIKVSVDGCSPYLTLPKSTCDAITDHLPVDYDQSLGLYIWKTDDPKYSQIVSSASSLDFTFLGGSNTQTVTISVPFRHLNLTLTAPLVDSDKQYFPCYTGASGGYTLGRAFLQDAFVGAHWDQKLWWLAQAPGPNIPSAKIITLRESDQEIQASTNDWKESWAGSWKALTAEDVASSATVTPLSSVPTSSSSSTPAPTTPAGGLSTGAMAGIGVGAGVAGLAIVGGLAYFFYRRRKTAAPKTEDATPSDTASYPPHGVPAGSYNPHGGSSLQGYYAPVKAPEADATQSMTQAYSHDPNSINQSMYDQQYPQQYAQQYPGAYAQPYPQQYSAELPTVSNTRSELPASMAYEAEASSGPSSGPSPNRQPSPNPPSHDPPSSSH